MSQRRVARDQMCHMKKITGEQKLLMWVYEEADLRDDELLGTVAHLSTNPVNLLLRTRLVHR